MVKNVKIVVITAIFTLLLAVFPGCGNKGPPTLPKPDSMAGKA